MISVTLGDCVEVLRARQGPLFDACVTDPPYHLQSIVNRFGGDNAAPAKRGKTGAYARAAKGFMGKTWDGGDVAFNPDTWRAIYDQLKPGGHLVAFSGTRTYHRMACAIEDAGFEIRDQLAWLYGSGFPKSHNIGAAIDKAAGRPREKVKGSGLGSSRSFADAPWTQENQGRINSKVAATPEAEQWQGWGTALKPSVEPICLARKPLSEKSIAANVLKHGTGAINVDACRVDSEKLTGWCGKGAGGNTWHDGNMGLGKDGLPRPVQGRWPANIIHDGSDEVLAGFPETGAATTHKRRKRDVKETKTVGKWGMKARPDDVLGHDDNGGSAARFFYSAKAGPLDRLGSPHATVKPVDLMRWLVRLVTPPGGLILEPFAGSGKTGIAAMAEGFSCEMIDLMPEHVADIQRQLEILRGDSGKLLAQHMARNVEQKPLGGLFEGQAA